MSSLPTNLNKMKGKPPNIQATVGGRAVQVARPSAGFGDTGAASAAEY